MHITIDELRDYLMENESYREQLEDSHGVLYIYTSKDRVLGNVDRTYVAVSTIVDLEVADEYKRVHGVEFL